MDDTAIRPYPATRGCPMHPPAVLAELREDEPVSLVALWNGSPAWLVTRFEDVRSVLSDERFSSNAMLPGFPQLAPAQAAIRSDEDFEMPFVLMDQPEHGRLRGMLNREFMVRAVESMRPGMQRIVDECIDRLTGLPQPADLYGEFALVVPSAVISHLLGVPEEDRAFFQDRSLALLDPTGGPEKVLQASQDLDTYLGRLIDRRLDEPGADLLSRLVQERVCTGELTRAELVSMGTLLLVAGHDTTANSIALAMVDLFRRRETLETLRASPELIPVAIDESIRLNTIIQLGLGRIAVEDVEIGGVLIKEGDAVITSLAAANRDHEQFPNPHRLDLLRPNARQNLGFGFGPHQCLGQLLAKAELQIAVGSLLRRLPGLRLAVDTDGLEFRGDGMAVYGAVSVPVVW